LRVAAEHGGIDDAELANLGVDPAHVLDLSVSINPFGPCTAVAQALAHAPYHRYPDPEARACRRTMADALATTPERIAVGNGATELLWGLVGLLARRGRGPALLAEPCFGEVRAACRVHGVPVRAIRADRNGNIARDLDALAAAAREQPPCLVYLCNPSSPDGAITPIDEVAAFARTLSPLPLVLDESFLSLSDRHADLHVALPEHVVRVRSLTKDHGIPGVRVGYALAAPELVTALSQWRPAWTVGAAAQAVCSVALEQHAFLTDSRVRLRGERAALSTSLRDLGLECFPSGAPYLAFPYPDARALRRHLLREHAIAVRDCNSFGLPDVVRIGVTTAAARERLQTALEAVLAGAETR